MKLMSNNSPTEFINLTIESRHGKIVNNEPVFAVTSVNTRGVFDVLPEHENFISIIKDKVVIHKTRNENKEIKIDSGVLKAANNNVEIFLGTHSELN